jgi:trk system potassium uptake protein TrkH
MNAILRTIGILLSCLSISMLPPAAVASWYKDSSPVPFLIGFSLTLIAGVLLWRPGLKAKAELKVRDGFIVVTFFWVALCLFATIPLYLSVTPQISIIDAVFETVSGLTTTGATIFTKIGLLPHSVLYYRQQMQLLGGIGIVVLAVAVLPMLGVGGMQLYRAEIAGPMKNNKLTPRITHTAKALWSIYVVMTILCVLCYWLAGMSLFDAIGESFSTVSTGGFSVHDASFAFYQNQEINIIAMIFMLLGAINFSLHFHFLQSKSLKVYTKDHETKNYFIFIGIVIFIVFTALMLHRYDRLGPTIENTLFTVISLASTTGLTITNFSIWPTFLPYLLMFAAIIGGCSGSTAGGIKVIRALLLREQARRELTRMIHPRAVQTIKYGNVRLSDDVVSAIWGFVVLFILIYCVLLLALLATGLNLETAYATLTACISNVGASIGQVADNYHAINTPAKWILVLTMLIGRLEIFTLIVLLMPSYWRR